MMVISVKTLSYDTTLEAMKRLAGRIEKTRGLYRIGHRSTSCRARAGIPESRCRSPRKRLHLDQPIEAVYPGHRKPFDAALMTHSGRSTIQLLFDLTAQSSMSYDLAHYLAPEFIRGSPAVSSARSQTLVVVQSLSRRRRIDEAVTSRSGTERRPAQMM